MNEAFLSPLETMCSSLKLLNVMTHFLFVLSPPSLMLPDCTQSGSAWSMHHHATVFSLCIMQPLCFVLSGSKDVIVSHKTCLNSSGDLSRTRISFSCRSSPCCTGRERLCLTKLLLSSWSPLQLVGDLCFVCFAFNTPSVIS